MNGNPKGFNYKYTKHEILESSITRQWIEVQSNVQNAIRFLIEKYAYENGINDISKVIPAVRDAEYFKSEALYAAHSKNNEIKGISEITSVIATNTGNDVTGDSDYTDKQPAEYIEQIRVPTQINDTIRTVNQNIDKSAEPGTIGKADNADQEEVPDCYK